MTVRVYTGIGTSQFGAPLLVKELQKHLDVPVSGINSEEMRTTTGWREQTTTLIFAGQSVGQFKEALGGDVMQAIKDDIFRGRYDYIGICAGAAFAADKIKYRIRNALTQEPETIENTGLSLFFGMASGPARAVSEVPFSGRTENLHFIRLKKPGRAGSAVFHWGGPALIPYRRMREDEGRLLSYLNDEKTAMSYHVRYGDGNVYLYSYHPEIHAENVHAWAQTRELDNMEARRIISSARELDAHAFEQFLTETGLDKFALPKREEAACAASSYNLHLL